ncbi:protein of unknown function [Streptomyces sp. 2112.2]|uniref:DUF397 domain-containing protein n=1 Tax=Streptomyces sp. 2112.2 TaxID=1881024 RepID=UPI00089C6AC4|nr:DUF397 domain-containing protein [Streptomyces sp. 2112.2]SEF16469.1 protein of unknown function [Streptomyces sp. 2112.2]
MSNTAGRPSPTSLADANWFKSSASSANGGCLEVAFLGQGYVAVRDNEDIANPPFVVTEHVWNCWINGAKAGEFDIPA